MAVLAGVRVLVVDSSVSSRLHEQTKVSREPVPLKPRLHQGRRIAEGAVEVQKVIVSRELFEYEYEFFMGLELTQ